MMAYVARTISDETQTLVGQVGQISTDNPSHIVVTADLSSATWNTAATHKLLVVTGEVHVTIWAYCSDAVTNAGGSTSGIGINGSTDAFCSFTFVGATTGSVYVIGDSTWASGAALFGYQSTSVYKDRIIADTDIGYVIGGTPPDGGSVEFHCVWEPLSTGATVVAGDGSSL